jgi:hypothetical protein
MLSEAQRKRVWEGMLAAEIRANYFADLSARLYAYQRQATWATLVFSSGAVVTVLASLPPQWTWVRVFMTLATVLLSAYSVVRQNQKFAVDASDLHLRWNRIASEYESVWENVYALDSLVRLNAIDERTRELSKAGAPFHYDAKRMLKWENHVVNHRLARAA